MTVEIQAKWTKIELKLGFCHFLKFGLLVFFEVGYNDSL